MWKKDKSNRGDDPAPAVKDEAVKVEEGKVNAEDVLADSPATTATNSNSKLNIKPARRTLHKIFIIISILTSLCALWMIAVQVLGFVVYVNGPVDYVLRSYIIAFCILVVFVELEWPAKVREARLLYYWITRGLLYVFIGVLGLQENDSEVKEGLSESYATMLEIAKVGAWNMIGCGLLYFVMGVLCQQLVLKKMRTSYQAKVAQAKGLGSSEKKEDSGKDAEEEGVEVAFGEDVDDALEGDEWWDGNKTEEKGSTERESDVENAQGKSTPDSLGEEKTGGSDLNEKKSGENDSTKRESDGEKAQDESTTEAEAEAKSSLTSDEKEGSDGKSS